MNNRVRQKLAPVLAGGKLWPKLIGEHRINCRIDRFNGSAITRRAVTRLRREANAAALS